MRRGLPIAAVACKLAPRHSDTGQVCMPQQDERSGQNCSALCRCPGRVSILCSIVRLDSSRGALSRQPFGLGAWVLGTAPAGADEAHVDLEAGPVIRIILLIRVLRHATSQASISD